MAKEKVITLKDFGAQLKTDFKRSRKKIVAGLIEAAFVSEALIAQDTPVDTGDTRARWMTIIEDDGAAVVNDSPVALYLEEGTRPHRPPLWPIARWLMRKEGIGAGGVRELSDLPPELVAAARSIADKIEREGTPPRYMVRDNMDKMTMIAKRRVEAHLAKIGAKAGA